MSERISNYIGGKKVTSSSQNMLDLYNPALGESNQKLLLSTAEETREAIQVAKKAFPIWSNITPLRRSRILSKFKNLFETHLDDLAKTITQSHGKTLSDAKGEAIRGMEVVEFALGIPHLLKGEHSMNVGTRVDSFSIYQPLGVCAGITPFNFPVMVPMWMFPIALACGNTFILKPSEKDPQCSLLLAEWLSEAGLPDGAFNVVNGDKEVVDVLLTDPDVSAVSFVGSTPIAEYIYHTGSQHGKRIQALGGAKNHMVVMPDADRKQTIDAILGSAYGSAGERCMAISVVVFVGDELADEFVDTLVPRIRELKIGNGLEPEIEMGPLVNQAHWKRVQSYVDLGVSEGAKLLVDGRKTHVSGHEKGFFMGPCLFDHVEASMRIYQEEIFGPVLCLLRADSYESALKLVNEHPFGNGVALFTRDGDTARQFYAEAQVGMIGINIPIPVPMAFHSFGGWKRSLFGVQHMHGPEGVRFYTRMKTMTTRWPTGIRVGSEFSMPTMQ